MTTTSPYEKLLRAPHGATSPSVPVPTLPRGECGMTNGTHVRTMSSCDAGREAWVITLSTSGRRYRNTHKQLASIGFRVRPFKPLSSDNDSRVLSFEKQFLKPGEQLGVSRRAISLTLSHADLWRTFPAPAHAKWLWIFEDDAALDPLWSEHADRVHAPWLHVVATPQAATLCLLRSQATCAGAPMSAH